MDPPADLVARARSGDRAAFAALYDATQRPLYLYVLGIVGHVEDAEDAVHTAYLRAWRELPALRCDDRFSPWLFRIVRNAARDLARRGRAHSPLDETMAAPVADDARPLSDLLDGLDPDTRALVVLRHGLGWGADEIARVLDASAPTVRRRLARAVEHLRRREVGRTVHER